MRIAPRNGPINNRILRRTEESPSQIKFYDRFIVPLLRMIEKVLPPLVGLSLVCVCSCPRVASRMAA